MDGSGPLDEPPTSKLNAWLVGNLVYLFAIHSWQQKIDEKFIICASYCKFICFISFLATPSPYHQPPGSVLLLQLGCGTAWVCHRRDMPRFQKLLNPQPEPVEDDVATVEVSASTSSFMPRFGGSDAVRRKAVGSLGSNRHSAGQQDTKQLSP